jgi:hypothetical protein
MDAIKMRVNISSQFTVEKGDSENCYRDLIL